MDPIDLVEVSTRLRRISAEAMAAAGALAALDQVRWHSPTAEIYRDHLHERAREIQTLADAANDLAGQIDAVGRDASRRLAALFAQLRTTQRDLESLATGVGEAAGDAVQDLRERLASAHRRLQQARGVLDRIRRVRTGVPW